jgi:hypothetical protein
MKRKLRDAAFAAILTAVSAIGLDGHDLVSAEMT